MSERSYPGLLDDRDGGLTDFGRTVMDARVFGFIPETETCAGWEVGRLQGLADQVSRAWAPYRGLPSLLPDAQRDLHGRIYAEAISRARAAGWDPELRDED
ncbi:hypothetical protein [Pinisolibacter sp.]|uniref:hypothetical protein n=1 Tax=Pinisolibacter sp. TaxID=2172024 RepID=UPI002FDE75F3